MSNKFVRDKLLVSGYIHQNNIKIPADIIQLCFQWYHIRLFFEYYPSREAQIMNDETTIIKFKAFENYDDAYYSCYGSIIMPSMDNNCIYEYNIILTGQSGIVIRICDAEFINTDTWFYNGDLNKSKYYGLYGWDGHTMSPYLRYSDTFNYKKHEINEVKLIYDANNSTLSVLFLANFPISSVTDLTHSYFNVSLLNMVASITSCLYAECVL